MATMLWLHQINNWLLKGRPSPQLAAGTWDSTACQAERDPVPLKGKRLQTRTRTSGSPLLVGGSCFYFTQEPMRWSPKKAIPQMGTVEVLFAERSDCDVPCCFYRESISLLDLCSHLCPGSANRKRRTNVRRKVKGKPNGSCQFEEVAYLKTPPC